MYRISIFETSKTKITEITQYQSFKLVTHQGLTPNQLEFETTVNKLLPDCFQIGFLVEVKTSRGEIIFKGRISNAAPISIRNARRNWQIEALGLEAALSHCRLSAAYDDLTVSEMVKSIIDNSDSGLVYSPNSIDETGQKISLSFDQTPARALNLLAELAGGFELSLKDNVIYFTAPLNQANKVWQYTPEKVIRIAKNSRNIINSVIIRGARLANQTYLNFVKEDEESVNLFGRRQKVIQARNISESFIAEQLARLILERYSTPLWEGYFLSESDKFELGDLVRIQGVLPNTETLEFKVSQIVYTTENTEIHCARGQSEFQELIAAFTAEEETLELITLSLNDAVNQRVRSFSLSGLQFYKNYYAPGQIYQQGSLSYSDGYLYLADEIFPWFLAAENIQPTTSPPLLKDLNAHNLLYAQLEKDSASTDSKGIVSHHGDRNKIYATTSLTAPVEDDQYYYVEIGRWDNSVDPARLTLINGGETTVYGDDLRVGTLNADLVNVESTAGSNAVHIGDITDDKGSGNRIILGNWVAQTGGVDASSGLLCKHANGDYTVLNANGLMLKSGSGEKRYLYNSLSGTLAWMVDTNSAPDSAVNDPTGLGITIREVTVNVPDTSIKSAGEWISSITISPLKVHPLFTGSSRTTNVTLLNNAKSAWVTVTPGDLEYLQEIYTDIFVENCVIQDSTTLKYYISAANQYVLDNHPTAGYSYWGVSLQGGVRQLIWFLAV